MIIKFIECSKKMPPNDNTRIIVKTAISGYISTVGKELYNTPDPWNWIKRHWAWMLFDDEVWEELNNENTNSL